MTFVDNVAILAIENCLLCPLEHIFTGKTVLDMDDQQIQEIAAEPPNIQKDRERLNEELGKLRKGLQTLNAFSMADSLLRARPILGIYIPYIGSWNYRLIEVSFQQDRQSPEPNPQPLKAQLRQLRWRPLLLVLVCSRKFRLLRLVGSTSRHHVDMCKR